MIRDRADVALQAPLGQLERELIEQFVRSLGYDPARLGALPDAVRDSLLRDASVYASAKLSEVESRSHFVDAIHEGVGGARRAD